MEHFLTTLPPYVHQYINKYPPTECFNVLKELVSFAVLYSNDRERTNLLTLDLLHKRADQAVIHRPYTSSTLTLSSLASTLSVPSVMSPDHSAHLHVTPETTTLSNATNTNHPKQTVTTHSDNGYECKSILEEEEHDRLLGSGALAPILNDTATTTTTTDKRANPPKSTTMPYTFPDWWAHPDTESCDGSAGKTSLRSISPSSNNNHNERQRLTKTPERLMTRTQEMNITNWIPVDFNENSKPLRSQTTSRPSSVYNPPIPDLRSYLGTTTTTSKKPQGTANNTVKATRRTSVHSTSLCESPTVTPTLGPSRSNKTTTTATKTTTTTTASPSLSRSSSTSTSYRPGQTATVRARAEQAKQRQLQLEEEKRKAATAKLTSRTSLRLKQTATSGIDWEAIKQDRRKTLPVQPN